MSLPSSMYLGRIASKKALRLSTSAPYPMRRVPPFCGPAAAEADAAVVGDGPVLGGAAQPARVAITKSATGNLRRVITRSSSLRSALCAEGASLGAGYS